MKAPVLGSLLAALGGLSSTALAMPNGHADGDLLQARQDTQTTANAPTRTAPPIGLTTGNLNTAMNPTGTGTNSAKSGTQSGTQSGASSSSGPRVTTSDGKTITIKPTASHTEFNLQDPPGGVAMMTPAPILGLQMYKIGDKVTFGWNYTSLQGSPTAINVMVTNTAARNAYTVTANMTFETSAVVTWDTEKARNTEIANPLLTDLYTLVIWDADSSPTAAAEPGYLAPFNSLVFGLYFKRPYKDLGQFVCVTCSAAPGGSDQRAMALAFSFSVATVLACTWFVTGALF